jgi:hypothetical protein
MTQHLRHSRREGLATANIMQAVHCTEHLPCISYILHLCKPVSQNECETYPSKCMRATGPYTPTSKIARINWKNCFLAQQ